MKDPREDELVVQDATTRQEAWKCRANIEERLPHRTVAFSYDSRHVAIGTTNQGVRMVEAATGRQLSSFPALFVTGVAFSPDDQRIAVATGLRGRGSVSVLDATTGQVLSTFRGHSGTVGCIAFSPDGRRIASTMELDYIEADPAKTAARVWDTVTGDETLALGGGSEPAFFAAWSPDGQRLIAAGLTTVKVWEATTAREILAIPVAGVNLAFAPDGRQVLVDATARVHLRGIATYTSPRILDAPRDRNSRGPPNC